MEKQPFPQAITFFQDFYCSPLQLNMENLYEVSNRKPNQTKDVENAWMCLDDIETAFARTIPLWLFGFLY